ncbi:MAG: hypothetical protein JKY46_08995 [Robiginitomaculum sp.]|nr:hypothetical protein [Robiginitomaculum sp.]
MEFEAFRTIAQIAAALAGFIGIIIAVRVRLNGLPPMQLAGFLQTSMGALGFALLPDFAIGLGISDQLVWQILCGLLGVYHLFIFSFFIWHYPDLKKMPLFQICIAIASVPVIGIKLAAGAGLFLDYAPDIYHLGLLWLLGVSIFFFTQVLMNDREA